MGAEIEIEIRGTQCQMIYFVSIMIEMVHFVSIMIEMVVVRGEEERRCF
jgi:hypothetical protein